MVHTIDKIVQLTQQPEFNPTGLKTFRPFTSVERA